MSDDPPLVTIKKMYRKLMENGTSLHDIDEMDIHWFFEVMGDDKEARKEVPIDAVF